MSYDNDKKLIAKPIDTTDIAAALGISSDDVGTLCASKEINMYARYKPIRFNKWSELTESEREGMPSDAADNIHFGIQITGPASGELDNTLSEIHDTEFKYIRPEGGAASPYRMTDFDGYKHDAFPNPGASFQISSKNGLLEGYFNDEDHQQGSLAQIVVQYDDTNIYGVDFTEMFKDNAESIQNALSRSYPCILVTDSAGKSYFTALDYPGELGGTPAARPLYYNGVYQRNSNWSVRFGKPTLSNGINPSTTPPWSAPQEGMKATMFLLKSADINGPYLDLAKTQNFSENWISLEIGNSYLIASKPVVLPADIIGAPLELKRYGAASVYFEPVGISYENNSFSVNYVREGAVTETVIVKTIAKIDSISVVKRAEVTPLLGNPTALFTADDFGFEFFAPGQTYAVQITVETADSVGTTIKRQTFTFTA